MDGEPGRPGALARALVTAPPLERRPRRSVPDENGCLRFAPSRLAGHPLAPEEIVVAWEAGLRETEAPHAWLLGPVRGAAEVARGTAEHVRGLQVDADGLVVCLAYPTPDWSERMEHPALWPLVGEPEDGGGRGGGFFRWSAEGDALERVEPTRRSRIDRVEIVSEPELGAASLAASGGLDLAVVYGRSAGELLAASGVPLRLERLPTWDTTYALWLDDRSRWVNDPTFRRWLATALDRRDLVDYVFGERAEAAHALTAGASGPSLLAPPRRPFSSHSAPRLVLGYDRRDSLAGSLAARVKAVLESAGVTVRLAEAQDAGFQLMLLAHRPPLDDPLLALYDTMWPLRADAAEPFRRLEQATRIEDRERRRRSAEAIERALIDDARLVPLVRVHAWLARHEGLAGVEVGGHGVLRLEHARWNR
jgi:hypothetical protein